VNHQVPFWDLTLQLLLLLLLLLLAAPEAGLSVQQQQA
jgi:hypothetical protein